ncbi:MAG: 3-phosphoserine/phosphohydroxythreonine transaminase [Anaerolineae bacterium CG_4_9_14_3_um_filter_57_17]|nr:MAG: 3-phosphoserine/phosphohydroxythreonine transaminase [Anaerolineae bacterium CG_4_9_14_3_um_filter_57_17]
MSEMKRAHNFNAGPAGLPLEVMLQAQAELLDYKGTGMSIIEMSHRSKEFEAMINEAEADMRELLAIPANYKVLFMQGGASLQFSTIPMNFRPAGASADYIVTGAWSKKALQEAQKLGAVHASADMKAANYNGLPASLALDPKAAYLYYCSNETIHGVEFFHTPKAPAGVELICDSSSDFMSRPVDISQYAYFYAGAQKNVGPAGVVIGILREDMLARVPANLPVMLDYKVQAENNSLYNTPPCFSIYMVGLVMKWIKKMGGLAGIEARNTAKSGLIYKTIDSSGGFFKGHAQPEARSRMNVTFRLPTEELEAQFAAEAKKQNMIGLKGHRSVGGLRASIYNAVELSDVEVLTQFMQEFQKKNG